MDWAKTTASRNEKHYSFGIWCGYIRGSTVTTKLLSMQRPDWSNLHDMHKALDANTRKHQFPFGVCALYLLFINIHSRCCCSYIHYKDVTMSAISSQITSLISVYSTVYSGTDQRKHQSSASMAFVRGSHRWPVNSPHKWPVTRNMFPFDDVIMYRKQMRDGSKTCLAYIWVHSFVLEKNYFFTLFTRMAY